MILDLFVDCDDYVALLAALKFITKKECEDVKFIFVVNAFRSLQRTLLASFVIQSYFIEQGYEDRYLIVCGTNAQDTYFRMDEDDEEKLFKGSDNGYNVVDDAFGKKLIEAFNSKDTIMEYHNYYDCCDYKKVKLEQYNLNDFFESGDELRLCVCSSTEDIIAFLNLESIREKGVKIEAYIQGTCYADDNKNSDYFTLQVQDTLDTRVKSAQNTNGYNNAKYSRKFFDFLGENGIKAVFCDKTSSQLININPSELYSNITNFMGDDFINSELKRISVAWLSLWKYLILPSERVFTKKRAKETFGKRCDKYMTQDDYYKEIKDLIDGHDEVKDVMKNDSKKVAELYNGTLLYDLVTTLQCLNSLLVPIYGTSIYDSLGYVYNEGTNFEYVDGNQNLSDFVYNMMNFLFEKDILGDFNKPFAQKTSHRACFKCRGKIIN